MQEPTWHILGAGAIGCLFAQALLRGGSPICFIARSEPLIAQLVVERDGACDKTPVRACRAENCGPIHNLLITTKAYDVETALASVSQHLTPDATILLLVNGMGIAERLEAQYPSLSFYRGTTTQGALRIAPGHIRHTGVGETRIGRDNHEQAPPWFEQWQNSVEQCRWDSEIQAALWDKMAVNCVINPLTAVNDCHNGTLLESAQLRSHVEDLCSEITQVSYAVGFTKTAQTLHQRVKQVITATAENRSSMLQDVDFGRRTEIDYITGHLLQVAQEYGINARHNSRLFEQVKNIAS